MIFPQFVIYVLIYNYLKFRKDPSITSQEIANYLSVALAVALSVDCADKHIPSKTSRSVSSVPWINPAIRGKIRRKNATHAKAKKSGSAKIRAKFETLRREIKADIRKQNDLYVKNLVCDVKDFYQYINSQKKDTQGIPPLEKRNDGGVAQLESEKAAEFNGQFTDVFTKSEYSQVPLLDRSVPFMEDNVVTKEGVTKLLKCLNPSNALGYDELHPRVLKELVTELDPIFRIYSSCQLTLVRSLRIPNER